VLLEALGTYFIYQSCSCLHPLLPCWWCRSDQTPKPSLIPH